MTKRLAFIACLSVLLLIPACQNSPMTPTTPQNKVVSIAVNSPTGTKLDVGVTVLFTATATMSNGPKQRITLGEWSSSNPSVATVDPSGSVTITGVGFADIVMTYSGKIGALTIEGLGESGMTLGVFVGTWQATKAEGWRVVRAGDGWAEVPGSRRDLVAEGGTVTLVLEANMAYTITVTVPGATPGADTGSWHYSTYSGHSQIDFYPASLPPDFGYGDAPAFLVELSGNTLTLWDSGLSFLPFDFGWNPFETSLNLAFTRK